MRKRFEVVFNIPSPYRLHMLKELHRQLVERGIEFHVHFMSKGHKNRPKAWLNPQIDFPHTYWRDYGLGEHHFNLGLIWFILRHPPEWLLAGSPYDTFTCIFILLFARVPNKIAGAEGNTKTPGKIHGLIGWFKRLIYSKAKFASVPGHDAVRYFELHQGLTRRKMPNPVILPNLVDENRFRPRKEWPIEEVVQARKNMGADAATKLCIVPARLEPVKGLLPFIEKLSKDMLNGWKITILGQGSLKSQLVELIENRGLSCNFIILDYVPYEKMPLFYASSDLLLLPSVYDPNPLSVPEALFSGLPVALSDQAGNVEEGVSDNRNGWILPVKDSGRYSSVLMKVFSSSKEELVAMGECSLKENARFWDTEKSVKKYLDTVIG